MADQHVAGGDDGERVAALELDGDARRERRIVELGDRQAGEPEQAREAEESVELVQVVLVDLELLEEHGADARRQALRDLEAHRGAEASLPDLPVDERQQVGRLVLEDVEIHVARHAERIAAVDAHPRDQLAEVPGDELLERHERAAGPPHLDASAAGSPAP